VLLLTQQRLLRQVVAPLTHRQHRAVLPVVRQLLLLLELRPQLALVRDRDGDLLLRLRQLLAHVDEDLVQHLLRVLRPRDRIVDVRAEQRRQLLKDSHGPIPVARPARRALLDDRGQFGMWLVAASHALVLLRSSLKSSVSSSSASDSTTSCSSMP
jgi:hypothetical protein